MKRNGWKRSDMYHGNKSAQPIKRNPYVSQRGHSFKGLNEDYGPHSDSGGCWVKGINQWINKVNYKRSQIDWHNSEKFNDEDMYIRVRTVTCG